MDLFPSLESFQALVIRRGDIFVLKDPGSAQKQVIKGSRPNNIESGSCSNRLDSQVDVDVANGERCIASETWDFDRLLYERDS